VVDLKRVIRKNGGPRRRRGARGRWPKKAYLFLGAIVVGIAGYMPCGIVDGLDITHSPKKQGFPQNRNFSLNSKNILPETERDHTNQIYVHCRFLRHKAGGNQPLVFT
jgi:hypothetical protein